jgi:hypothetical protein
VKELIKSGWFIFFCISVTALNAQNGFLQSLDSVHMLIGDQQYLSLSAKNKIAGDQPFKILDTLSWIQILNKGEWNQKDDHFERKILFTVFDSGYFKIPALGVFENVQGVEGNDLYLEVQYPTDTLNQLRPIKFIEETETESQFIFFLISGLLLIAGMLFILWIFFKADRIKPGTVQWSEEKKIWQQCLDALEALRNEKLWQQGFYKVYYDKLNHVLRVFLSSGFKMPALENTSSEIISLIKNHNKEIQGWEILRDCFVESDLVKFANHLPEIDKHEKWLDFAFQFIKSNAALSESIVEENRIHWLALLGESQAQQFENPYETVPEELISLYNPAKTGKLELLDRIIFKIPFTIPQTWIEWHQMHTGIFYRWHFNILSISNHKIIQLLLFVFLLPFIALFLPFIALMSFIKKEKLFTRGVFGLSANKKLVYKKP